MGSITNLDDYRNRKENRLIKEKSILIRAMNAIGYRILAVKPIAFLFQSKHFLVSVGIQIKE